MAANDLVTLEAVKSYLVVAKDDQDAFLQSLISAASVFLLAQMNRREGLLHDYKYTPGLAEIPEDVRFACMELVGLRYKEKNRIGIKSENLREQTVSYSLKDISEFGRAVIRQYRRVTP